MASLLSGDGIEAPACWGMPEAGYGKLLPAAPDRVPVEILVEFTI